MITGPLIIGFRHPQVHYILEEWVHPLIRLLFQTNRY